MRPSISRNSFQPPSSLRETTPPPTTTTATNLPPEVALNESNDNAEKGFYISFDNDAPKKPKPTLRQKKASPKKEQRSMSQYSENAMDDYSAGNFLSSRAESPSVERHLKENFREAEKEKQRLAAEREHMRQEMRDRELKREIDKEQRQRERNREATTTGVGLVIGNQLANPDPVRKFFFSFAS